MCVAAYINSDENTCCVFLFNTTVAIEQCMINIARNHFVRWSTLERHAGVCM